MAKTIHTEVNEKIKLAKTYAEDGAFSTAAMILREAAAMYEQRGREINAELGRQL